MLNTRIQTNQQFSTQKTTTQYSKTALNFVLATGTFLFLKTTGICWPLSVAGAEAAEAAGQTEEYDLNTDTQNPIAIREEALLQNQQFYLTQHRSLQQTTLQSDTIIEGNVIGQLSVGTEITDFTIQENTAYVTAGELGFHIIDVTDVTNPIPLGQYNTTGFAHEFQLLNNYAYIAYDLAGLRIVDVRDVTNPFLAGVYMMGDNPEKEAVTRVAVAGDVAVLGKSDSTELKAIDVSDPTQVFRVWIDTPGEAYGVDVVGNFAYVANTDWGAGLQIIDISNPADPQLACNYEISDDAEDVTIVGNLAYLVGGSTDLRIIDVTNSAVPQLIGTYKMSGSAHGITVVGNFAYVAFGSSGLQVIDISNPANPQLIGSYVTPGSAYGVSVIGNFTYVADYTAGLQIIDISNPANPQLIGGYITPGTAYGVNVLGNLAYVADRASGLQIIDISNPANLQLIGSYNTPGDAYDVAIVGNLAYVADEYDGLQIINITNSTNPQFVGSYDTIDRAYGVSVVDNFAYVADYTAGLQIINTDTSQLLVFSFKNQALEEQQLFSYNSYLFLTQEDSGLVSISKDALVYKGYDTSDSIVRDIVIVDDLAYVANSRLGLKIIDVNNPAEPWVVGSYDTLDRAYGVTVVGNLAYVAAEDAGLQLIDIGNPANPQLIGSYDTPDRANAVTVVDNLAYVAAEDAGLQLIDISNPANPQLVGSYDTPGRANGVAVVDSFAYVADSSSGLQIIDLSISPPYIGYYNTPSSRAYGVIVVDSFAYVADRTSGLQIINVSNPADPQIVGSIPGSTHDVSVVGNLAYLTGSDSDLKIIDISNPAVPQLIGNYDTNRWSYGISIVGNLVYVACRSSGLQVIDVSNPTNPPLVGSYNTPGDAYDVAIVGNLAYLADESSGLLIIDISNLANLQSVGSCDTPGNAYGVTVVGNLAYVADGASGLQIIDVSNPADPQLVGNYDTPGYAHGVTVIGNLAYVADDDKGLQIINISNPADPQLVITYDTPHTARAVMIESNLAYVADEDSGLQIIDITNPVQYIIGGYSMPSFDVTLVSNLAYVAGSGWQIIDISNPANPQLVGNHAIPALRITVVGNLAYIGGGDTGVQIIDISNPARAQLIRSFDTLGKTRTIDITNNTAYVADGEAGVQIIDLSFQDNTFVTEGIPSYMTAFGDIAYLTDTHKNLYILDITDPSKMTEISHYQLAFHALDIEFSDNHLYVAQGVDGLEIIDVQNPNAPMQVSHNMTDITGVSNLEIDNNRLYVENSAGEIKIINLTLRTLNAPTILNNRLIINEGELITLTSNDLSATNAEILDADIEFIIEDVINGQFEHQSERDTIINRFTQQQLIDGEIRFASLSFPGIPDTEVSYRVAATNGIQSTFHNATIDFNARPHLINNYLSLKRGEKITITSKELLATDFDDNDLDLKIQIFNIQHGKFIWKDGVLTQEFWQGNITDGLIQFIHDNSENSPSYQVSVYDKRMVVGNNTVHVTFDRASFTEANNTPVITGGIIAGAAGLGLLTVGLFAVGHHINNSRSRKKHPFADYLARELKLSGVANFDNHEGKNYLSAVDAIITALQEQGYDVMHMDAMQQKELAVDIALTAKQTITNEVNCCGEIKITPWALQQHARALITSMLQYRLQGQQNSFPLDDTPYPNDEENSFLADGIAQVRQMFSFGRGRAEFV